MLAVLRIRNERTGTWVKRKFRLTRSTDFKRVRRTGKSYAHPLVVLVALPNPEKALRIAVAASRTVGGAVERNRAKRRLRAALHECHTSLHPGWDLIFFARAPICKAKYADIQAGVLQVLTRAALLPSKQVEINDRA